MKKRWPLVVVSAVSGLAWGAIVTFLLLEPQQRTTFGYGFLFSPAIGVLAGMIAGRFRDADVFSMATVSLLSLYLSATLYGLGTALILRFIDPRHLGPVLTMALLFPWTMTLGGFVFWMWPLAFLNHRFVARFA
jgi:hypothetical protein